MERQKCYVNHPQGTSLIREALPHTVETVSVPLMSVSAFVKFAREEPFSACYLLHSRNCPGNRQPRVINHSWYTVFSPGWAQCGACSVCLTWRQRDKHSEDMIKVKMTFLKALPVCWSVLFTLCFRLFIFSTVRSYTYIFTQSLDYFCNLNLNLQSFLDSWSKHWCTYCCKVDTDYEHYL